MTQTTKHANNAVKLTLATALAFGGANAAPKEAEACDLACMLFMIPPVLSKPYVVPDTNGTATQVLPALAPTCETNSDEDHLGEQNCVTEIPGEISSVPNDDIATREEQVEPDGPSLEN